MGASTEHAENAEKENGKPPDRPVLNALAPHKKLSKESEASKTSERQRKLGEFTESPMVSAVVVVLIFVDLGCTAINTILENTDMLNPKYGEVGERLARLTHDICVS